MTVGTNATEGKLALRSTMNMATVGSTKPLVSIYQTVGIYLR